MPTYVDSIILRVVGVDLDDVIVKVDEEISRSVKAVNTLNRKRRARGFKRANVIIKLTLEVEQIDDERAPNWHQMLVDGTEFDVIKKPNAGKTVYYTGCTVESISDSNQDGDSSRKISLAVLDRTER